MAPTPPHKGGQRPRAGQALTLGGHGPTVDAAPLAGRVAEGWCPAREAVAVLVVVADLEGGPGRGISTLESSSLPTGPAPGDPAAQPQGTRTPWPLHFFPQPAISKKEVFLHCPSKQICSEEETESSAQPGTHGTQKGSPLQAPAVHIWKPEKPRTGQQLTKSLYSSICN